MAKATKPQTPESQLQKRFGKLTVVNFGSRRGDLIWVLSCDCGQLVYLESLHRARREVRSCQSCSFRAQRKWRIGEVAVTRISTPYIPLGEQVIVQKQMTETANPMLSVEYRGKVETCLASNLQSLKVIF